MKPIPLLFCVMLLLCLLVQSASATTFYIDNSGAPACSNSASGGSEANPWCTVNYAVNRVAAGDIVYVKNGTYNEQVLISGKNGGPSYITFQNYPGHSPILRGSGVHTGRHKIIDSNYIKFVGFRITDIQQGLFVESSHHILLQSLNVYTVGQEAVHIKMNSSFVTLEDSVIHDTRAWQYNGEGVYIGMSTSDQPSSPPYDNTNNILIKNNTIYNTNDECIEVKPGTYSVVLDGNTMHSCNLDPGITALNWGAIEVMHPQHFYGSNPNHVVKNNIIATTKTGLGMHTGGTVFNNVIYGQTGSFRGISIDNPDSDNYTRFIYHNTIDLPSSRAVVSSGGAPTNIRNNIGPNTASNIATASSYYVNQSGANYHLVAGSAPINAGVDLIGTVPADIEGRGRSVSAPPDLGAYEFASGASDTTPPSIPTSLSATAMSSSVVSLNWTASTDNSAVAGYRIYRNGTQIATSTTTSYSNNGLSASTQYAYSIAAYDGTGNVSSQSTAVQVTTAPASAAVVPVSSCAQATVQAAINSAQNGDTVLDTGWYLHMVLVSHD